MRLKALAFGSFFWCLYFRLRICAFFWVCVSEYHFAGDKCSPRLGEKASWNSLRPKDRALKLLQHLRVAAAVRAQHAARSRCACAAMALLTYGSARRQRRWRLAHGKLEREERASEFRAPPRFVFIFIARVYCTSMRIIPPELDGTSRALGR